MKVKVAKTLKSVEKSGALLKKSKSGIQKEKKPNPALKLSTAKVALVRGAKAAAGEEKLPEKPAFSLLLNSKKQTQAKKPAVGKKNGQENSSPPVEQKNGTGPAEKQKNAKSDPAVKQAKGAGPAKKQQNAEVKPDVKKPSVLLVKKAKGVAPPAKKQKHPAKGKPAAAVKKEVEAGDQKPPTETSDAKKLKKRLAAQLKALKRAERKVEDGVPEKADEATLALVPQQLISKESFQKVFEIVRKSVNDKEKQLFGDDLKYCLQIVSVKVPRCPLRNCRISLPHPLQRPDDEICLIVTDLVRGREIDTASTLHYWEDKLSELNLDYKLQVIPFQQLKRDYISYEMKRKLAQRYERFLVDSRISGNVVSFFGVQFSKRSKVPTPVKLTNDAKIKKEIEQAMQRQTYQQSNIGRSTEIKFGAQWMPLEHIVENGMELLEKLKTAYPGGWLNIHSVNVVTATTMQSSFPIYVSTIDPNLVPVPVMIGTREKFIKKQQALIEKYSGGEYEVTKDGVVRKKRKLNLDGEPMNAEESDVEVEELEPEEDDNWLPYDDDLPARRRTGGPKRQKGPKMRVK